MYSEKDFQAINARIRKNALVLVPLLAAILAAYIYALKAGIHWLAMVAGPLLFVAACYGILAYLWPNMRYKGFLADMENGLTRDVKGTILEISDTPEPQDGAMVLPVRVRLAESAEERGETRHTSALGERLRLEDTRDDEDERIVYLNVSKRAGFPGPGAMVCLRCCGRHVRDVEVVC